MLGLLLAWSAFGATCLGLLGTFKLSASTRKIIRFTGALSSFALFINSIGNQPVLVVIAFMFLTVFYLFASLNKKIEKKFNEEIEKEDKTDN